MDFQEKIDKTGQQGEMKKGEICEFIEIFEAESCGYGKVEERDSGILLAVNTQLFHSRNKG